MTAGFIVESDKLPVIGTVTRKLAIGLRELLALAIITILVIICIILAVLLSKAKSSAHKSSPTAAAQTGSKNQCFDKLCLDSMSHVLADMNQNQQPCDNFYQYACGQYVSSHNVNKDKKSSALLDISNKNMARIENLLLYDKTYQWSSEKKAKDFYKSCMDDYTTERLRGVPFIKRVLPLLGGAYFLNTWNSSTFNLLNTLNKVQSDLGVNAFWLFRVERDVTNNLQDRIIELLPAGISRHLTVYHYLGFRGRKAIADYMKFIRNVANLLIRDSGIKMDSKEQVNRVSQFAKDAWSVEKIIVRFAAMQRPTDKPYENENRMTLKELADGTHNTIDWIAQAQYMFSDYEVSGNTKVVVHHKKYLMSMVDYIKNITDSDSHRVLHNYLVWRALETYLQDLSWDYVHANREMYVDIHGAPNFLGKKLYCYLRIVSRMPDAIGALFVANHFADKNRDKVKDITKVIKDQILQIVEKTIWMDDRTRQLAKTKLLKTVYNIGYPELYMNQRDMDRIYQNLEVKKDDYFGNVLSYVKYQRGLWTRELLYGENLDKWYYKPFDTAIAAVFYLNQLVLPAGLLQFPVYDYRMPHYSTFGSMGSFIGRFLLHLVDERGSHWGSSNKYLGASTTWWTGQTSRSYSKIKQCFIDKYDQEQSARSYPEQELYSKHINSTVYAYEALATSTGVRAAYSAYQIWMQIHTDLNAPNSLALTNKQLFFISFAQTWCTNRGQINFYQLVQEAKPKEEIRVNYALRDLKEFSDAFQCPPGSAMNPSKKCHLF